MIEYNIDKYGNVKCTCGRIIDPDLTNLNDKCVYCYCCERLGGAVVDYTSRYRFYHDEFLEVTKFRYEDDGNGYIDKMEDKYKKIERCPFCKKSLVRFIQVRLMSYDKWLAKFKSISR